MMQERTGYKYTNPGNRHISKDISFSTFQNQETSKWW